MPGTQNVPNERHGDVQGQRELRWGCAPVETAGAVDKAGARWGEGGGLEQSVQTRRKLSVGERGSWLGGEQLAASLISSCDRDGQAWPGPMAGMEPGSAGTSPPVTHDVFIKSKGKITTIHGGWCEEALLGRGGQSLAQGQCGPWQTCLPSLPQLDQPTIQPVCTVNHMV